MPPRRVNIKFVKRLVEKRVAKAIEEYEKTRANLDNAGSSGGNTRNARGTMNVQACSHKTFMNGKTHSFNGTKGVVGLRRWIEKIEQVFKICKCAEEDKVMFAASTFEGHSLTWMEQELWTLTLKGDDIKAYNNRFYELALMCPKLVPNEEKILIGISKGFLKESRETSLLQGPQLFVMQSTWLVNWSSKQFMEKDCRVRVPTTGGNALQDVTCFRCGKKGHYRHKCLKGRNQQNERARVAAYAMVENPQQNPNMVTSMLLLNDHYASVLFDSGAERNFVSTEFTPFINISSVTLNTSYEVELADGKVVSSFDVIVGRDWLSYHRAVIVCYEKIVRIPLSNGEILEIQGERPEKGPKSLSCIKADEKKLDDIRIVCDNSKVFPGDLTGLPPVREINFAST
uniref:Putative reverse transcriptase domain, ribonuclease H-like domain, aspartic peptidase domain protein n=1 Tax=Tanacetum cinerariifolium TaxID=118510 RepID=A0A6L2KPM3_TANCI|nr:putative reverse transcriptase domain, ribonuclease H-like domain, aspartic peptidase domain protein [Tanacetum cinerariifolium]